jgi:hypothetical protein
VSALEIIGAVIGAMIIGTVLWKLIRGGTVPDDGKVEDHWPVS